MKRMENLLKFEFGDWEPEVIGSMAGLERRRLRRVAEQYIGDLLARAARRGMALSLDAVPVLEDGRMAFSLRLKLPLVGRGKGRRPARWTGTVMASLLEALLREPAAKPARRRKAAPS